MPHQLHDYIGGKIYLDIDESPMMRARVEGTYEPWKTRVLQSILAAGRTFVDIGTNKGYFALLAAKLLRGTGRVLAFEPEPNNCRCIRHSVEANGYANVTLFELALSDQAGAATLHLGEKSGWHTLLPGLPQRQQGTIDVQRRRLDAVFEESGIERADVIKIDVEGAELQVLAGARGTLTRNERVVLLMDLHPYLGASPVAVCRLLSDLGFSLYDMQIPHQPVAASNQLTVLYAERPPAARARYRLERGNEQSTSTC
ncbi:MAG: FkbM family methyltransferase [Planctomycetota bacterium]|nr:FkbM family methyltransferase [Planctomycetota bacterium]